MSKVGTDPAFFLFGDVQVNHARIPGLNLVDSADMIMAIEKAKAISASLPPSSTPIPAIQPEHFFTVTTFLVLLALALSVAVIGWLAIFALRRLGLHRFSGVRPGATNPRQR